MDIDILKLCLPHLIASAKKHNSSSSLPHTTTSGPSGRIIYVSSTVHYTGLPLQTHVSVAKAGVDALSNNVAIEYGPLGITSNVLTPGPITGTEGMDRLSKKARSADPKSVAKRIPLGRWGLTKEIADATVFLFSDTGNYVSGSAIVVDGASWRMGYGPGSSDFEYPDFLLSGEEVSGVSGGKKSRL
jgi:2,4-dienoyl-CoA reductase [(3E)-enoyl-CoA-producing], peroxisomal